MGYRNMDKVKSNISKWVKEGFSSQNDIDLIEDFGKYLSKYISNSQIRRAYSEVIRLKMDYSHQDMLLISPKLAYAAGRENNYKKKEAYQDFATAVSEGIKTVDKADDITGKKHRFQNLAAFFEATIAYHKAHGGD